MLVAAQRDFFAEVRRLRGVHYTEEYARHRGTTTISIHLHDTPTSPLGPFVGIDPITKTARGKAMLQAMAFLRTVHNPHPQVDYLRFARCALDDVPILLFPESRPVGWFDRSDVIGVDMEGSPAALVQLACAMGVVIHRLDCPWVRTILDDPRHVHAIFGAHEANEVVRPYDVQGEVHKALPPIHARQPWSLTDVIGFLLLPNTIIVKDKTIHRRVDWTAVARSGQMTHEAALYAACDAWVTRALAMVQIHRDQSSG